MKLKVMSHVFWKGKVTNFDITVSENEIRLYPMFGDMYRWIHTHCKGTDDFIDENINCVVKFLEKRLHQKVEKVPWERENKMHPGQNWWYFRFYVNGKNVDDIVNKLINP